jgi:hypothetical protein
MAVQAKITEVTSIKWVDQNYGQLDSYDIKPPVLFPCALIDLVGFTYEDQPDGRQRANGRLVISLSTAPYTPSNNVTSNERVAKALNYYDIEEAVVAALHNWTPTPGADKLLRRSVDKVEREDNIRERTLQFEVSFTDAAAVPVRTRVAVSEPVIGGDITP